MRKEEYSLFSSENPGCAYQPVLGRDTWVRDASSKGRIVQGAHRKKEASYQGVIVQESYAPRKFVRRQYIPGHIVIASKYRARNNQLQKLRKIILHTVQKIRFMFSHKWNCTASFLIRTFMYLRGIYKFPGAVCLFGCIKISRPILGIFKSLTDTWMWKLGDRTF